MHENSPNFINGKNEIGQTLGTQSKQVTQH